jgi:selT/selW/selH-like putative selenoprotein
LPQATSLAARISKECGIEAALIKGSNGVFDVEVDGKLVFSKHKMGRFPKEEEILDHLRK